MTNTTIPTSIDITTLSSEQINSLKVQYKEGKELLKYFHDTMKNFQFPERRQKSFDTVYFETHLPVIEDALRRLGKIK